MVKVISKFIRLPLKRWKKRELARLIIAHGEVEGAQVRCNIVVCMVDGSATITAESEELDESTLTSRLSNLKIELTGLLT